MLDCDYFHVGNCYTQGLFSADWKIRVTAGKHWNAAKAAVMKYLLDRTDGGEGVVMMDGMERSDDVVGAVVRTRAREETWMGSGSRCVTEYEVEIGGRMIDLRFAMGLYPRESHYERLKPKMSMNGFEY